MQELKQTVKQWLKSIGKDRVWLGNQLGATKRTVDTWFSVSRPIPADKIKLIKLLMSETKENGGINDFFFSIPLSLYNDFQPKAQELGMSVSEWILYILKMNAGNGRLRKIVKEEQDKMKKRNQSA